MLTANKGPSACKAFGVYLELEAGRHASMETLPVDAAFSVVICGATEKESLKLLTDWTVSTSYLFPFHNNSAEWRL